MAINRKAPLALTAEIKLTLKRDPVVITTGVFPRRAHVVPECSLTYALVNNKNILSPYLNILITWESL